MISFSCSHCGMKLKVRTKFAGRSSKCPTCTKPLVVPHPEETQAHVPAGPIDGTASSLIQAGVDAGVTLEGGVSSKAGQKSVGELLSRRTRRSGRYVIDREIARGGMGAVLRGVDCDIRREVAIKYLLDQGDPTKKSRFIEEAQITGQLAHPNIVPIYELGVDHQKRLFFAMKKIDGYSLAEVLDELRQNKLAEKQWTLGRLLNILVNVCNGLAYAHSRGAIHRDLKPANIMVGDFGEVYVMDWGLAKVLKDVSPASAAGPSSLPPSASGSSLRVSNLVTNRQADADLTQEGSVLGTPVYMPPEQASGQVQDVDQQSDVYSLGAILYEMLTLQPPIKKDGGYLSVLMLVIQGEITLPEQRAPDRFRRGKIPKELSAICMKALAKNKEDRYSTVEALRRDLELYLEGRSVSAKEDTRREVIWKFAKRNKAFGAAAALLMMVLICSLGLIGKAWWDTSRANTAYLTEQGEKDRRTAKAVPAFVRAARQVAADGEIADALTQVDYALEYQPDNVEARMLRAQLLIVQKDFAAGRAELDRYLRHQPKDTDARVLMELCVTAKPDDPSFLFAMAQVFQRQKAFGLAARLLKDVARLAEGRKALLPLYQKQLEAAWPEAGTGLTLNAQGQLTLSLRVQIADLHPLKGMQINCLYLSNCSKITDLSPLRGMPLVALGLSSCREIRDLTPLQGMPLTTLTLGGCSATDLGPLQGMPLTTLTLYECSATNLGPLQGMSLNSLVLKVCPALHDLTTLRGMPLTSLVLYDCPVSDLSPLQGMQLNSLTLSYCATLHDLRPLRGMPLTRIYLDACAADDLSPLEGMKLEQITMNFPRSIKKGIEVLRPMKTLKRIHLGGGNGLTFTPEQFWKKYDAKEFAR